jgi:hypothetical protein
MIIDNSSGGGVGGGTGGGGGGRGGGGIGLGGGGGDVGGICAQHIRTHSHSREPGRHIIDHNKKTGRSVP